MVKLYKTSKRRLIYKTHFLLLSVHLVSNSSVQPDISFHMNTHIHSLSITRKDILAIIKSLDLYKSHGWDNIYIKMIQMYRESLILPLQMILEAASIFLTQFISRRQKNADAKVK